MSRSAFCSAEVTLRGRFRVGPSSAEAQKHCIPFPVRCGSPESGVSVPRLFSRRPSSPFFPFTRKRTPPETAFPASRRPVWSCIQCIFHVAALFYLTYSVYFVFQLCLVLHIVYISRFGSVWSYIQCIFPVAVLLGLTYSVYFMFQLCLVLHIVYISCCSSAWSYIQCILSIAALHDAAYSVGRWKADVG